MPNFLDYTQQTTQAYLKVIGEGTAIDLKRNDFLAGGISILAKVGIERKATRQSFAIPTQHANARINYG